MAAKASISSGYLLRLLLVALVCLAYAGWSAYDGFVAYPHHNAGFDKREELKTLYPAGWQEEWEKVAKENNWSPTLGEKKSAFSMIAQYVQLGITLPIGLLFALGWITNRGRWIASDEQGVSTSSGLHVPFSSIRRIDKQRWRNKGIAVAWYDLGQGEKKLVIDDWKYERVPTDQILREVESHLTRDQIINGEPEPVEEASSEPEEPAS